MARTMLKAVCQEALQVTAVLASCSWVLAIGCCIRHSKICLHHTLLLRPAVENLADPGHVPFTHHATVSKRSTSSVIDLEVTRRGPDGFDGRWAAGPRQGTMG